MSKLKEGGDLNQRHTWTKPIDGGPKSLNAGLKLDEDGNDGEGTLEPRKVEKYDIFKAVPSY